MNVKVVHMSTGEDIIVEVINDTEDTLEVSTPLVAGPTAQGQIGFGPWAPLVKEGETIKLDKKFIMFYGEPNPDVAEQYQKIFSPIETPSKKLIL